MGKQFNRYWVPNDERSWLGEGAFSEVFLVVELSSSPRKASRRIERAMKVMDSNEMAGNELAVLIRLDHENVVKYYDHFEVNVRGVGYQSIVNLCVIIEYCEVFLFSFL